MKHSLEFLPDEISIRILKELSKRDILSCRLVSFLMRAKIDRIFNSKFCILLNDKTKEGFSKKPALQLNFSLMKVETLAASGYISLDKLYFVGVTNLEITEIITRRDFYQLIGLTNNLQILHLTSSLLGGVEKLLERATRPPLNATKSLYSILSTTIATLLENVSFSGQKKNSWDNLHELHLKLNYISPSTQGFSTHTLVQNLKSVAHLQVPNLKSFSITVEESKDNEMFFFEINSLLNAIPTKAYPSLQCISISAYKCRPQNNHRGNPKNNDTPQVTSKFHNLRLSEFTLKLHSGHRHPIPDTLRELLCNQTTLRSLTLTGFQHPISPDFNDLINTIIYKNKSTLKNKIITLT